MVEGLGFRAFHTEPSTTNQYPSSINPQLTSRSQDRDLWTALGRNTHVEPIHHNPETV